MSVKCLVSIMNTVFIKGVVSVIGGGKVDIDGKGEKETGREEEEKKETVGSARNTANLIQGMAADPDFTPDNIRGAWRANVKHNKDEKAMKRDNAGVPIHFWNDSLAVKLGCNSLTND